MIIEYVLPICYRTYTLNKVFSSFVLVVMLSVGVLVTV